MHRDDALMARVAEDDQAAFAEVVARHEPTVRRVCRLLLKQNADEHAQEVFLALWLKRREYKAQGQLRAYLCTLARRRCFSELRRRKLLAWFRAQPHPQSFDPTNADDVVRALQVLPEELRLPLHLRFVEDLDYAEIAAVIGRTESTARSRIHYGLKALQEVIQ